LRLSHKLRQSFDVFAHRNRPRCAPPDEGD
jgi:hypothetical protein